MVILGIRKLLYNHCYQLLDFGDQRSSQIYGNFGDHFGDPRIALQPLLSITAFWGSKKQQMYGNFEGFPLMIAHCLGW